MSPIDAHIPKDTPIKVVPATALPHIDGALSYRANAPVRVGQLVSTPLGKREVVGMVIGAANDTDINGMTLKTVTPYDADYHLTPDMRQFMDWVAKWYLEKPGLVLKMASSVPSALKQDALTMGYHAVATPDQANTVRRQNILENLSGKMPETLSAIRELTGATATTIKAMCKDGLLAAVPVKPDHDHQYQADSNMIRDRQQKLTVEQAAAAKTLADAVAEQEYTAFLLDGVTGSGKTEVYFEAVAEALKSGRQALILLPEIALSQAFEARCHERFGFRPHLWHSGLGDSRRRAVWREAIRGTPMVVAGARSALFLPFRNPGVVVVDEEHELSYRQQDGVRYHARDMAVLRARLSRIPVILSSATPSLESLVNVEQGKYQHIRLFSRFGSAGMPDIKLIDLGKTPAERRRWLSPPLVDAIGKALEKKEQVLLFLNRRGYAPMSLCLSCRERIVCPNCSAWLVTHKSAGELRCHHCGHNSRFPSVCPSCQTEGMIMPCGPGVERLSEEVELRFPDARQGIFSSDAITTPALAEQFFNAVYNDEIDIIIGTQMVAKGHHFPDLTLVGVVDADLGLGGADLRGGELSWQLLTQVAGRAGRESRPGQVLLQTAMPEATVLQSLIHDDRESFIAAEKAARSEASMPPYGRLAAVILSGREEARLMMMAKQMANDWPHFEGVTLLGPAPAPLRLLRRNYRVRFLLKSSREVNLQRVISSWLDRITIPSAINCQIDIDPVSFF